MNKIRNVKYGTNLRKMVLHPSMLILFSLIQINLKVKYAIWLTLCDIIWLNVYVEKCFLLHEIVGVPLLYIWYHSIIRVTTPLIHFSFEIELFLHKLYDHLSVLFYSSWPFEQCNSVAKGNKETKYSYKYLWRENV